MKKKTHRKQGFTLIELLVVITIIGILASISVPVVTSVQKRGQRINALSNVRSIVVACRSFASEWQTFPSFDPHADRSGGAPESFSTSTEAFNVLIPSYIDTERIFWVQTQDPDRQLPPVEDGILESEENVYCYVAGQNDTSYSSSPLVADGLMDSPGEYGEYHPWLSERRALVGFVGGHATEMALSSNQPGATVRSGDGTVMNIFEKRETDEDGRATGGWLATDTSNVLLPD